MAYGPLTENSEYLKKVKIGSDPTDIVTTAEKTAAEAWADARINSKLKTTFSQVSGAYPPLIVKIARMLGSAELYTYIYGFKTTEGQQTNENGPAKLLIRQADDLLNDILSGKTTLYDAAGNEITGFGSTSGANSCDSVDEADEKFIFDPRAELKDYKEPADAYDEAEYE